MRRLVDQGKGFVTLAWVADRQMAIQKSLLLNLLRRWKAMQHDFEKGYWMTSCSPTNDWRMGQSVALRGMNLPLTLRI